MTDGELTNLQKAEREALLAAAPNNVADVRAVFCVVSGLRTYRAAVAKALAEVHRDGEMNAVTVKNLRTACEEVEDLEP